MMRALAPMLVLSMYSAAVIAEWSAIDRSENATMYIDYSTLTIANKTAKMWSMVDYQAADSGTGVRSIKAHNEYDCSRQRSRTLRLVIYGGPMGGGENIASLASPSSWTAIVPDTVQQRQWKMACMPVK